MPTPRRTPRAAAHAAAAALALTALGAPAAAQARATLDAGMASVRYGDSLPITSASVGPTLRWESGHAALAAGGTFSQLRPQGGLPSWSSQGSVAGSLFTPALGALRGEAVAAAGGSAHEDRTRTGQWRTTGRAHLMGVARGLWLGGGGGRTWDGASWRSLGVGEAGAWARSGPAMVVAVATPTWVSTRESTRLVRYTDTELSARWVGGRVELGGAAGARAGQVADATAGSERVWGSASAAVWLVGPVALVGSAGSYPVDFTQGFPGGRYGSLALRMAARRPAPAAAVSAPAARAAAPVVRREITEFAVDPGPGATRVIRVRAAGPGPVLVSGDFTSWEAVPLSPVGGGWWTAAVAIEPGTHQVSVRVGDGSWAPPPGLLAVADESGESAGLLVLP